MDIILASASPRRRALLREMGLTFTVLPSDFEEHLDESRSAQLVAEELALGKAEAVAKDHPDAIVIASDTIVAIDDKQLEKPVDDEDAKRLLTLLSGRSNNVISSLVILWKARRYRFVGHDTATVYFKPYNEVAIDAYIATGDTKDKAGAYGIQSGAAPLIEAIRGNYDTIIGIPTIPLARELQALGVPCKPALPELPAGVTWLT